jgi:hypothetical protein
MTSGYIIERLPADKADQVFPLIRMAERDLELDDWRRICRSAFYNDDGASAGRGILTAVGPRGYVHGLCIEGPAHDVGGDRTMDVSHFIVGSALDPDGVAAALLHGLVNDARGKDCARLRISMAAADIPTLLVLGKACDSVGPSSLEIELH